MCRIWVVKNSVMCRRSVGMTDVRTVATQTAALMTICLDLNLLKI